MKKLSSVLEKIIEKIESSPISFSLWMGTFFAIIGARLLVESWLADFSRQSLHFLFFEFAHTFLFFLLSYILFLLLLSKATETLASKTANILLWGFLIILTPPIIDAVISHGAGFWSFYKFDGLGGLWLRFLTFFGDKPEIGITYGVRAEVALSLFFFFTYIFLKTKKLLSSLLWALLGYILFFILGTFPSYITIAITGLDKGFLAVTATDVAQMFLTPAPILSQPSGDIVSMLNVRMSIVYAIFLSLLIPLIGLLKYKKESLSLMRNIRLPQILFHGGLLFVGGGLALLFSPTPIRPELFDMLAFFLLLIAVGFAWIASVVVNDLFDTKIDALTNPARPLPQKIFSRKQFRTVGWITFFASLLCSAIAFAPGVGILLLYQALAWLYSASPLRLKRFPIIATLGSAFASILIVFLGFLAVTPTGSLAHFPGKITLLLIIAYTLSLPIKDFKDIKGDKADGVYTIPVIFGETKGRLIVATGIFISFILSIWALNDTSLTFPAFLFGGLAFWTVATSHRWKHFSLHPRQLPLALFFFTALYGIILISKLLPQM